jgi:hypothetical protein
MLTFYRNISIKLQYFLIIIYWLTTTFILNAFTYPYNFIYYPDYIEAVILIIQIPIQYIVSKEKRYVPFISYVHQLFLLSFIGSLLLIPIIVIQQKINVNLFSYTGYFMLVVMVLIMLHFKVIHIMQLNKVLCASWIVYRLLLLIYIILTNLYF